VATFSSSFFLCITFSFFFYHAPLPRLLSRVISIFTPNKCSQYTQITHSYHSSSTRKDKDSEIQILIFVCWFRITVFLIRPLARFILFFFAHFVQNDALLHHYLQNHLANYHLYDNADVVVAVDVVDGEVDLMVGGPK